MRTNPLSKAKEMEERVAIIITAYLEGISFGTTKRVRPNLYHLCSQLEPPSLATAWGGADRS